MSADDDRKAAVEEDDQGGDQTVGSTEEEKVEDEEPAQTTPTAPEEAFQLLVATLEKTGRIGIGKIVLREREHVVAMRAYGQGLLLQTLHFSDEVRSVDEIPTISGMKAPKFSPKELELAEKLVTSLTDEGMDFDIGKFTDEYTAKLRQMVEAKASGKTVSAASSTPEPVATTDVTAALGSIESGEENNETEIETEKPSCGRNRRYFPDSPDVYRICRRNICLPHTQR